MSISALVEVLGFEILGERMEGVIATTMLQEQHSKYYGGSKALEYVEVPVPAPGKGEVLVRVKASSVNPVDWRIQGGLAKHLLPLRFPFVPGTDVALGPNVTTLTPGDKIITYLHILQGGALAEYAVAAAARTVKRPAKISAAEDASAVVAAYTALQSARQAGITSFTGVAASTSTSCSSARQAGSVSSSCNLQTTGPGAIPWLPETSAVRNLIHGTTTSSSTTRAAHCQAAV